MATIRTSPKAFPPLTNIACITPFIIFSAGSRAAEKAAKFAEVIADLMVAHGGGNSRLAVDRLSDIGCAALRKRGLSIHDGQAVLEHARAVKSDGELALMQKSIAVCETGVRRMREATAPGMTENALWALLHHANIEHGGEWLETRLLSSGARTFPWFRESSMRRLEAGDMVCLDTDLIGPYGYCADMSRSWMCGDAPPSDAQKRLYALAHAQIEYNKSILKAGLSFREIAQKAWQIPDEFIDHRYSVLIHGVGLADEYPSIQHACDFAARGYDGVTQENMTLCVESYIGSTKNRPRRKIRGASGAYRRWHPPTHHRPAGNRLAIIRW